MGFGVTFGVNPVEPPDDDGYKLGGSFLVETGVGTVELRDALATVGPALVQKHYHDFAVGSVDGDGPSELSARYHVSADERRVATGL